MQNQTLRNRFSKNSRNNFQAWKVELYEHNRTQNV